MDDIGMLELETAKDLYEKMKCDFDILSKHQSSYSFFNFILDANHLIDWIKEDVTFPINKLEKAKEIYKLSSFKLIKDMANRSKHFIREANIRKNPISKDEVIPGFDYSKLDYSKLNFGGPIFIVEYRGKEVDLYEECMKVFNFYKEIFE